MKIWIYIYVTSDMTSMVFRKETTYEQWLSLVEIFSSSTQSWIIDLQSHLLTLCKESIFVTKYVSKLQTISHRLAFIGEPILEKYLIMYALFGLSRNPNYNPLDSLFNYDAWQT